MVKKINVQRVDHKTLPLKLAFPLIRQAVEEALKPIGDEFGLTFTVPAGGRYEPETFLEFKVQGAKKGAISLGEKAFRAHSKLNGLDPEYWNRPIALDSAGTIHRIVDYKPNRSKFPVITERADGKRFKWSIWSIQAAIAHDKAQIEKAFPGT